MDGLDDLGVPLFLETPIWLMGGLEVTSPFKGLGCFFSKTVGHQLIVYYPFWGESNNTNLLQFYGISHITMH